MASSLLGVNILVSRMGMYKEKDMGGFYEPGQEVEYIASAQVSLDMT